MTVNPLIDLPHVRRLSVSIRCLLLFPILLSAQNRSLQPPMRALTAASYTLEIFAYVLTDDIDQFYKIEADLFLSINDVITAAGIELV